MARLPAVGGQGHVDGEVDAHRVAAMTTLHPMTTKRFWL